MRAGGGPVRVLQLVGAMDRGGIETWLMHVLRGADPARLRMDFLAHVHTPGAYDAEVRALGGRVLLAPVARRPAAYALGLARVLRREGPYDVVHSHLHHFSGLPLLVARACGVPVRIAHSHTDSTLLERRARLARRVYLEAMHRLITAHTTRGLACSRTAAADLFGPGWERDPRFGLLYCGIDLGPFRTAGGDARGGSAGLRAALGLEARARVVGHVGRFVPLKNHAFLLEVAQVLCARDPRVQLLLVGDGPVRDEVRRGVEARGLAGRVLLPGVRSDVAALMGVMDAFVLPSLCEGLPLVGLEAQAAGLPLVVSEGVTGELDALPEQVTRLPLEAGAVAWADALEAALERGRLGPGEGAQRLARTPFALEPSLRGLEAAYGL